VKATLAGNVDVAAVEAHLERFVISCPLCKSVGQLGVAQHVCGIEASDGGVDAIHAVMILCKRCGYLIPLCADHVAGLNGNGGSKASKRPSGRGARRARGAPPRVRERG
jgi:hypothetical protein